MKSNSSLMSSILQYAMEGKLVSQKNDNANSFDFLSSFLKKKSKKITRVIFENNNYYEIVDGKKECVSDEISVKIPPSWTYIRLKDLADKILVGGTPSRIISSYWDNGTIPWIKLGDMKSKYINGSSEHITIEGLNNSSAKLLFPGTILFSIIADIGKTSFLNVKAATNQQIAAVILDNILNKEFIYYFLKYSAIYANKQSYGTAYNSINIKILKNMLIPFPPLEEQERIVAKIKKLEPLVNEYEKLKRDYDSIYSNLGMKLRFSVIKAAIDGNLTSHKLNDMSVFDLVKSIKKEHINLLSTNKIHKQKHDCDILLKNGLYTLVTNGEEIPVDPKIINSLPKNWSLITQKELFWLDNGVKTSGESLPILDVNYLRTNQNPSFGTSGVIVTPHDKVILVDGNAGEVFTPPCKGYMGSTFKILKFTKLMNYDFLLLILKSSNGKYKNHQIIPHLDKVSFRNDLVMIPPLDEQERIVAKVNKALNKIDNF